MCLCTAEKKCVLHARDITPFNPMETTIGGKTFKVKVKEPIPESFSLEYFTTEDHSLAEFLNARFHNTGDVPIAVMLLYKPGDFLDMSGSFGVTEDFHYQILFDSRKRAESAADQRQSRLS